MLFFSILCGLIAAIITSFFYGFIGYVIAGTVTMLTVVMFFSFGGPTLIRSLMKLFIPKSFFRAKTNR